MKCGPRWVDYLFVAHDRFGVELGEGKVESAGNFVCVPPSPPPLSPCPYRLLLVNLLTM